MCEGAKTEPVYFRSFKHHFKLGLLNVEIVEGAGVPMTLVQEAIRLKQSAAELARRLKDSTQNFDQVWCVFDVDEHPNVPEARRLAADAGISTAVSNACFELWLLLHFQPQTAFIDRGNVQAECRRVMPGYDKTPKFEILAPRYSDAVRNALELSRRNERNGTQTDNPSTEVHLLTERLLESGKPALLSALRRD